jgi:hypothetical protein
MTVCPNCGTALDDECPECGTKLSGKNARRSDERGDNMKEEDFPF